MTDEVPNDITTDLPADLDLGIDVATAPELEDSELGAALEALLLVVDEPADEESLTAAVGQPAGLAFSL
jgi:segregation and condensation protein B